MVTKDYGRGHFAGIAVVGQGRVTAVPDLVLFSIGADARAGTAAEAMDEASTAMRAMVEAAEAAGIEGADRQTQGMHTSTWKGRQVGLRYHSRQQLNLRVRDVDGAGETLRRILAAGGNAAEVHHSRFGLADREPYAEMARNAAMADARQRAEQFAREAGRPLGPSARCPRGGR